MLVWPTGHRWGPPFWGKLSVDARTSRQYRWFRRSQPDVLGLIDTPVSVLRGCMANSTARDSGATRKLTIDK